MQTRAVVVRKDENGQRVYELRESVRSAGENWHCYSYVMFWDRSRSTESELQMSKIWSDLCIFIGSYPWSTAEQGKISAQPHTTLCIQFLDWENNDKNNRLPLGKQICFTIVWGCAEILPRTDAQITSPSSQYFPLYSKKKFHGAMFGNRSEDTSNWNESEHQ